MRAVFDIDSEDPFEQAGPTHARQHTRGVSVMGCVWVLMLRWARNNLRAKLRVGCEYAMEADQMQPRAGHQRGQALHEIERRHHRVAGAIFVGYLELQHDIAGGSAFEPFVSNGGAGDVAAPAGAAGEGAGENGFRNFCRNKSSSAAGTSPGNNEIAVGDTSKKRF
jgi:hypothetical protein